MEVKRQVLDYFRSRTEIPGNSEDEQLECNYFAVGLIDSLGIVTMITEFEQMFGITFPYEVLQSENFKTIKGIITIIEGLRK